MTVTAGFEVPSAMQGPYLEWRFAWIRRTRMWRGWRFRISQNLSSRRRATAQPRVRLEILAANVSPEGNEVNIVGQITNLTGETLIISQKDAALKHGGRRAIADQQLSARFPVGESGQQPAVGIQTYFCQTRSISGYVYAA